MQEAEARFVTITASQSGEGLLLAYHWDLDGRLLGFQAESATGAYPSVCDLCPAADWIEREVRDTYAAEFTGRTMEPLLLRQGQQPGVNRKEEAR